MSLWLHRTLGQLVTCHHGQSSNRCVSHSISFLIIELFRGYFWTSGVSVGSYFPVLYQCADFFFEVYGIFLGGPGLTP